jgi:hypothetical protein
MSFEIPRPDSGINFAEYKRAHEGSYTPERLTHHFNTQMGMASNLLSTLRTRINTAENPEIRMADIDALIKSTIEHLVTAHEIGNLLSDMLRRQDAPP